MHRNGGSCYASLLAKSIDMMWCGSYPLFCAGHLHWSCDVSMNWLHWSTGPIGRDGEWLTWQLA
jgi:hypothetical protein